MCACSIVIYMYMYVCMSIYRYRTFLVYFLEVCTTYRLSKVPAQKKTAMLIIYEIVNFLSSLFTLCYFFLSFYI